MDKCNKTNFITKDDLVLRSDISSVAYDHISNLFYFSSACF